MGFLTALQDIFSSPVTLHIDFAQNCFYATLIKKGNLVSFKGMVSNHILQSYFAGARPDSNSDRAILSFADAMRLYGDIDTGALSSNKVEITFSDAAQPIHFQLLQNEWQIQFVYIRDTGCIRRELPRSITLLQNGFFLEKDTIWYLPGGKQADIAQNDTVQGAGIIQLIRNNDAPYIHCDLVMATDNLIVLTSQPISNRQIALSMQQLVPSNQWGPLAGLPNMVIHQNKVYKIIPAEASQEIFNNELTRILTGAEIPDFAEKHAPLIAQFGDQKTKELFSKDSVFVDLKALSLILQCQVIEKNGVGKAWAVPMVRFGNQLIPAKELSEQLDSGYAEVQGKWISANILATMGIGPMGRLVDGTPLAPIELRPDEVIFRGSQRLTGPWSELQFDQSAWQTSGTTEDLFFAHMEFLRHHGISGGAVIADPTHSPSLFSKYARMISLFGGKTLILLRKKYYDDCVLAGGFGDALVFKCQKGDPPFPARFSGTVVCFYTHLEKLPPILSARWDLLILAEPDALFKTNRSSVFANTKSITARLRIGVFTAPYNSFSPQQGAAIEELFRMNNMANSQLSRLIIRDSTSEIPLPAPYRFTAKTLKPMDKSFTMELSGVEDKGIPIPPRQNSVTTSNGLRVNISIGVETSQSSFKKQAQQYTNTTCNQANFVPFMSYWPTYSSMTEAQHKWYFYWRGQARNGNYVQTDLSYIFLYVYELINDVGFGSSIEGYQKLLAIWQAYRTAFPKLDNYVPDWTLDFVVLHKLDDQLAEFLGGIQGFQDSALLCMQLQKNYIEQNQPISMSAILPLASYRMEKSKFYQEGYSTLIETELGKIFLKINSAMLERYGKNLFQMFCPSGTITQNRTCYRSAVYDGSASYTIEYPDFANHSPLISFIDSILRYTENKLREKVGFNGRLRGITIDEAWKQLIDAEFGTPTKEVQQQPAKKTARISLSAEAVRSLRTESDELRDILHTEQDEPDIESVATFLAESPPKEIILVSSGKQLLTELEEVIAMLHNCNESQQELLRSIYENGWESNSGQLTAALGNGMIEMMVDEINGLAMEHMGTIVIAAEQDLYVLEDDFRDEFEHIYTHPALLDAQPLILSTDTASSPLEDLFSGMDDFQLEVLRLLICGEVNMENLTNMALAHGTMPELVFDTINEMAMSQIGDFLLDTANDLPTIGEEYMHYINQYFAKVVI